MLWSRYITRHFDNIFYSLVSSYIFNYIISKVKWLCIFFAPFTYYIAVLYFYDFRILANTQKKKQYIKTLPDSISQTPILHLPCLISIPTKYRQYK